MAPVVLDVASYASSVIPAPAAPSASKKIASEEVSTERKITLEDVPPAVVESVRAPTEVVKFDAAPPSMRTPPVPPLMSTRSAFTSASVEAALPRVMVFAAAPVPRFTAPVDPESTDTAPVVPEVRLSAVVAAEVIAPVPTKSRELISKLDPSTNSAPASALSLIVMAPVPGVISNSGPSTPNPPDPVFT